MTGRCWFGPTPLGVDARLIEGAPPRLAGMRRSISWIGPTVTGVATSKLSVSRPRAVTVVAAKKESFALGAAAGSVAALGGSFGGVSCAATGEHASRARAVARAPAARATGDPLAAPAGSPPMHLR